MEQQLNMNWSIKGKIVIKLFLYFIQRLNYLLWQNDLQKGLVYGL